MGLRFRVSSSRFRGGCRLLWEVGARSIYAVHVTVMDLSTAIQHAHVLGSCPRNGSCSTKSLLADRLGKLNAQTSLLKRRGASFELAGALFDAMKTYCAGEGSGHPGHVRLSDAIVRTCVEGNGPGVIKLEASKQHIYT